MVLRNTSSFSFLWNDPYLGCSEEKGKEIGGRRLFGFAFGGELKRAEGFVVKTDGLLACLLAGWLAGWLA